MKSHHKFIFGLICTILSIFSGSFLALADQNEDIPRARFMFLTDTTIQITPVGAPGTRPESFVLPIFGVVSNPANPGMVQSYVGRKFPQRAVHIKLIYVSDPKGRMDWLGVKVYINGIDIVTDMVRQGLLVPSGVCRSMPNMQYCRTLLHEAQDTMPGAPRSSGRPQGFHAGGSI